MVLVSDPLLSTAVFSCLFFAFLLCTVAKKSDTSLFPQSLTQDLKGFAILTVVFAHIGYFLSSTDKFLWPLSILSGVGVNLFLFLSGYGLSVSSMRTSPYIHRRLLKLFIPLWIILIAYFALDYFVLGRSYGSMYILRSFAGLFPRADLFQDVNSVLWYFSFILFYYLIYPVIFFRRHLWISALILFAFTNLIVQLDPRLLSDAMRLYQVHTLAFPLGMFVAWILKKPVGTKLHDTLNSLPRVVPLIATAIIAPVLIFLSINSGVDESPLREQIISIIIMLLVIVFFRLMPVRVKLLSLFGLISYEVYLIHWPLMSRFDFIYKHTYSWLATLLYLVAFIILGYALKKSSTFVLRKIKSPRSM